MPGNNYPKLHNAMWPGLVGKGPDSEPPIDLDTMLDLTAAARVDGVKFDGVDLFLSDPHTVIDSTDDDLKRLADKIAATGLRSARSSRRSGRRPAAARRWVGGGAQAASSTRSTRPAASRGSCATSASASPASSGSTPATGVHDWAQDPAENTEAIAETFSEACDVAEDYGERLAAEGEICWGGMHSWKHMVDLLEMVGRPKTLGFQADMAHTLLYTLGYNAPEDRILPEGLRLEGPQGARRGAQEAHARAAALDDRLPRRAERRHRQRRRLARQDRPPLPGDDPNGKLDIAHDAGFWLRDDKGELTKSLQAHLLGRLHVPQRVMMKQKTWNDILGAMIDGARRARLARNNRRGRRQHG